jgi:hypothetical protein
MKIGTGLQAKLRFCLRSLRGCNAGITDRRDFWSNGLKWYDMHTKSHDNRFRYLSNIAVNTATILEAVMLVLLIEGISEVIDSSGTICVPSPMTIGLGI